ERGARGGGGYCGLVHREKPRGVLGRAPVGRGEGGRWLSGGLPRNERGCRCSAALASESAGEGARRGAREGARIDQYRSGDRGAGRGVPDRVPTRTASDRKGWLRVERRLGVLRGCCRRGGRVDR